MIKETKKFREDKLKAISDARSILELAEKEKREMTPEQEKEYDAFLNEAQDLQKKIDRLEKLNELDHDDPALKVVTDDPKERTPEEVNAFDRAILNKQLKRQELTPEEKTFYDKRALSVGTDTAGGFVVDKQLDAMVQTALLAFGGMREAASIITTAQGGDMDFPTSNDTTNKGRWLAENAAVTETDIVLANVTLKDYIASSDLIRVSLKLMNDSNIDLAQYLAERLSERMARLINTAYTNGDGSAKPTGISVDSTEGKVSALSTMITFDELFDLKYLVDPLYRIGASWMFNDSTLKAISKLKDTTNQYIWQPSTRDGERDLLLGSPFVINQDVDSIGLNKKPIFFGNLKKYQIRDVGGVVLLRLNERYADNLQVAFTMFMRTDGKLIDAGTKPVKHMRNPNT